MYVYTRYELLNFLAFKWAGVSKGNISVTYNLRGFGKLELMDEEDMATMFTLLDENQLRRVFIFLRLIDGLSAQPSFGGSSQHVLDIVHYGNIDMVDGNAEKEPLVVDTCHKLRSEEWRHLISGPGQFNFEVVIFIRFLYSAKNVYVIDFVACLHILCYLGTDSTNAAIL